MGKYDEIMYTYLSDNRRFADLFNAACFGGRQVIQAENLLSDSERCQETGKSVFRDVKKHLKNGTRFIVAAIENQDRVDYTMPWRMMQYDQREYGAQITEIKRENRREWMEEHEAPLPWYKQFSEKDKLCPVYTICFYHGKEPWTGPRSLKDMIDFGENETGAEWANLFQDYGMNLVCADDADFASKCTTELRQLLQMLMLRNSGKKVRQAIVQEEYRRVDPETAEAILVLMDVRNPEEKLRKCENEEGGYDMCQAIEEIMEEGRASALVKSIENAMQNFHVSLQVACENLGATVEEYQKAKETLTI